MSKFVPHSLPGTIFMQPWWLDIVAKNRWYDIEIKKGFDLKARWPIVLKKKYGFTYIEMPVLTQKLGPWIKKEGDKQETIHSNERSILLELISNLPKFDRLSYNIDESIVSYLPFIWTGFKQKSVTSYRLDKPINPDKVWENLKSSVRRNLRRAQETCEITNNITTRELYDLIEITFNRKKHRLRYSFEMLNELADKAKEENRANIIGVKNRNKELIAAQLFIHDDEVTYYLAGGFDNEKVEAGAVSLGMLEGIKLAVKYDNSFDFEGSSIEGIERFFSSFGSYPMHFHNIQKVSNRYFPISLLKEAQKFYMAV